MAEEKKQKGQQEPASPEEQKERIDSMRTSGRKGCKMPRINVAFSGPNYEFVSIMSRIHGKSLTRYVNDLITAYREEHPDLYEKALALIAEAQGQTGDNDGDTEEESQ